MALTTDWGKSLDGAHVTRMNGRVYELRGRRRTPGGGSYVYDVTVDGELVATGGNLASAKTKAIRHAEGRHRRPTQQPVEERVPEAPLALPAPSKARSSNRLHLSLTADLPLGSLADHATLTDLIAEFTERLRAAADDEGDVQAETQVHFRQEL